MTDEELVDRIVSAVLDAPLDDPPEHIEVERPSVLSATFRLGGAAVTVIALPAAPAEQVEEIALRCNCEDTCACALYARPAAPDLVLEAYRGGVGRVLFYVLPAQLLAFADQAARLLRSAPPETKEGGSPP